MKFPLAFALALSIPVLPGCYLDYDGGGFTDPGVRAPGGYAGESNVTVGASELAGDLGRVNITGEANVVTAWETAEGEWRSTYLELWADDGRGQAMVGLTLDNAAVADLEPGASYNANVIACSGPDAYAWEYDQWTEDVVVEIEPGEIPDTIVVSFRAQVPVDYGSSRMHDIQGSVVVER